MEEKKKYIFFFLAMIVVFLFSLSFYLKYRNDKFISWDGFVYLTYSYSILQKNIFLDRIRSPLLVLVIPPNLEAARLLMSLYHLGITAFIFTIVYKLTSDWLSSFCSSLVYGINVYMLDFTRFVLSDLPAVFFFISSLYFFFGNNKKEKILSGILSGFSFAFRPDMGVLIFILFILNLEDKNNWKYFLPSLIAIGVILNFVFTLFVFKKIIFPPIEFVKVNFIEERMAFYTQTTSYDDYFWFIKNFVKNNIIAIPFFLISLFSLKNKYYLQFFILFLAFSTISIFLPKISDRIYITKMMPIFSILVGIGLSWLRSGLKITLSFVLVFLLLLGAIKALIIFKYFTWLPEKIEYKKEGRICSNEPFTYIYINKVPARLLSCKNISLEILFNECDYVYIFTYPESMCSEKDLETVRRFLSENFKIIRHEAGDFYVYEMYREKK